MKIGIHASYAANAYPTGVGNYAKNLILALINTDKKNEYFLYYKSRIKKENYLKFNVESIKFNSHVLSPENLRLVSKSKINPDILNKILESPITEEEQTEEPTTEETVDRKRNAGWFL